MAENARRDATSFQEEGDLKSAFVEFEKATTIILEIIPNHPDSEAHLNLMQRHSLCLVSDLHSLAPPHFLVLELPTGHLHISTDYIYDQKMNECSAFYKTDMETWPSSRHHRSCPVSNTIDG
jgi:hypothetical protein